MEAPAYPKCYSLEPATEAWLEIEAQQTQKSVPQIIVGLVEDECRRRNGFRVQESELRQAVLDLFSETHRSAAEPQLVKVRDDALERLRCLLY